MTTFKPNQRCYSCGEISCICGLDMSDEELDELLDQFDEYFYTPGGDEDEDQEDIDDENDR